MFTRWCQENYFSYMMQHYDIDGLVEYGAEELSGTVRVVNPAWRILDKQVPLPKPLANQLACLLYASGYAEDFNQAKAIVAVEATGLIISGN